MDIFLRYLQIVNPLQTLVEGNFFYNTFAVLTGTDLTNVLINNIVFRYNSYVLGDYGGNESIVVVGTVSHKNCKAVSISSEINGGKNGHQHVRLTKTRLTLYQTQSTKWNFDFGDVLLFNWIDEIMYSITLDNDAPLVSHAARASQGIYFTQISCFNLASDIHVSNYPRTIPFP